MTTTELPTTQEPTTTPVLPPPPPVEDFAIEEIVEDPSLQVRSSGTHQGTVDDYQERLEGGSEAPPVDLVRDPVTGLVRIAHGYHRLGAYKQAGRLTIPARVYEGDRTLALILAVKGNAENGRTWPWPEKEQVLIQWLHDPVLGKWSNYRLADHFGISRQTVMRRRKTLFGTDDAPATRVGSDGKEYTFLPRSAPVAVEAPSAPTEDIGGYLDHDTAPTQAQPVAASSATFSAPKMPAPSAGSYTNGSNGSTGYGKPPAQIVVMPVDSMAITWVLANGTEGEWVSDGGVTLPVAVRKYLQTLLES